MSIRAGALSPDGKLLALGVFLPDESNLPTRGAVRLLDAATGREFRTLARGDDDTDHCALAFTPDGKFLVSLGARSGLLRVEETASGTELLRQKFPGDVMSYLALSPDGKTLAVISGPNSRKMYLWRWQEGVEPRELKVRDRVGRDLCFSPDGKQLAECGDDDGTIRVWDVAAGRVTRKLEVPGDETYWHSFVAYTPDGKTLAASGYRRGWDGGVHLWDPATGKFLGRLECPGSGAGRLAVSADSRLLAAASDHGVRVWDLTTRREVAGDDEAHSGGVNRVVASTGGLVATGSDDHTVRLWDAATGRQRLRLDHGHWVRSVALSPDGTLVVSSSLDDKVRLWDAQTGREIYRLPGHGELGGRRAVGFTADGKRFQSWGDDYYLRVWEVRTGKALREHRIRPTGVKVPDEDDGDAREKLMMVGAAAFSADGTVFVLGLGTKLFVFDVDTGKEVRNFDTGQRNPEALAVSPDGKRLLLTGWGKPIQTRLTDGRTRHSTAEEHPVELWDLATGMRVWQVMLPGSISGAVAFSHDGKTLAAVDEKPAGRVRLWDAASGKEKPAITGVPGWASALAFSPDGRYLIVALEDTSALVWKLAK
jgi:WD40 repeat protein